MTKKAFDKESIRVEHSRACSKYERLGSNVQQALKGFLKDESLDVLDVVYRVKEFDSFWDKIERKGYGEPFREMEDICGVRIICFYPSDIEKVTQIVEREFDVRESADKSDLLEPDRFGYRSLHFVVTLKKEWLKAPNYRGLGGLKVEIQLRTILMHAWAGISHKLAYKKEEHVPTQFRRKLSRLSALFEIADEQFEGLRKERQDYADGLVAGKARTKSQFDPNQEMNLDSLQAFLNFYFPNRESVATDVPFLLDEILPLKLSIRDLENAYERGKEILSDLEEKSFDGRRVVRWSQTGVVRALLDLTNDAYWAGRKARLADLDDDGNVEEWIKTKEKFRSRIAQ